MASEIVNKSILETVLGELVAGSILSWYERSHQNFSPKESNQCVSSGFLPGFFPGDLSVLSDHFVEAGKKLWRNRFLSDVMFQPVS